ncbi:hypothetical protein H4219_001548 [Mycoemilia scoparia]|uniref:HMG box domain-containing protein n=1 Tax=Mycoemilia scoparia TaxID=417184 RepID=A0A9W8DRS7_9FUNG|nr:hypothetical protein H4219_001548 [Mycoemilia scoparia]
MSQATMSTSPSAASHCEVSSTSGVAGEAPPTSSGSGSSSIEQRLAAAGWKLESKPTEDKSPLHSRAPNSFILYRADKAKEIAMLHPNVNQSAISRMVADLWKQEPPAVKEKYRQRQIEEKKRFNERMKEKLAAFDRSMPNRRKRKANTAIIGTSSSMSASAKASPASFTRYSGSESASPSETNNSPYLDSAATAHPATAGPARHYYNHHHTSSVSSAPGLTLSQYKINGSASTPSTGEHHAVSTPNSSSVATWAQPIGESQSAFSFDFKRPQFPPQHASTLKNQDMDNDWSRRFSISSSAPNSPYERDIGGDDIIPSNRAKTPLVMFNEAPAPNGNQHESPSNGPSVFQRGLRNRNLPTTSIQNLLCDPLSRRQSLAVGMDVFLPNAPPQELKPTITEAMAAANIKSTEASHVSVPEGNHPICIPCPSNGTLVLTNVPQNCVIYIQPR